MSHLANPAGNLGSLARENLGSLVLADGSVFPGQLFGCPLKGQIPSHFGSPDPQGYGEVVFNTSLTGYQEILTDPSYYKQIVCMTAPHIGNTGINLEDVESARVWCSGFVIHEASDRVSNWRSSGDLNSYLIHHQIPALSGVDTRALTVHLRSLGVSRGLIVQRGQEEVAHQLLKELPGFDERDCIAEVTTRSPYIWPSTQEKTYRVIALDFGLKLNLLRELDELGCEVEVLPASTPAAEVLKRKPDGVFLSNGPGNPAVAQYAVQTVRELIGQVPIFGVCMGHQLLALAAGCKTFKLKFGHRGGNQPVMDRNSGRIEISSHNHGYAVENSALPDRVEVTHLNLNDKTIEGIAIKGAEAFSVQYHPEACPGPHDSRGLFKKFIETMSTHVSKVS